MFDLSRVGKQIKKYRINADMTQMELAERMGVSFQAVSSSALALPGPLP